MLGRTWLLAIAVVVTAVVVLLAASARERAVSTGYSGSAEATFVSGGNRILRYVYGGTDACVRELSPYWPIL